MRVRKRPLPYEEILFGLGVAHLVGTYGAAMTSSYCHALLLMLYWRQATCVNMWFFGVMR